MAVEITLRKWGNSIGAVFPQEFAKLNNLKPDDKITVELVRAADLSEEFGSLKLHRSSQKIKNELRRGW